MIRKFKFFEGIHKDVWVSSMSSRYVTRFWSNRTLDVYFNNNMTDNDLITYSSSSFSEDAVENLINRV